MENHHVQEPSQAEISGQKSWLTSLEDQGFRSELESSVHYGIALVRFLDNLDRSRSDHCDFERGLGNRFTLRDREPRIEEIVMVGERFSVQSYLENGYSYE